MKPFFTIPLLLLPLSCSMGPLIYESPSGQYVVSTGGTVLADRDGVEVEITTRRNDVIKYRVASEDSTSVANTYIPVWGLVEAAKVNAPAVLKGTKDPNVIPKDPNVIPKDPNIIPLDPNVIPK